MNINLLKSISKQNYTKIPLSFPQFNTNNQTGFNSCLPWLIVACDLQIERDTFGMLQCHPYPYEYVDTCKQCAHCAFFLGLQRKQGVNVKEGQQFDIRGTVDEFRQDINMYMYWRPGMDMFVTHIRRKQLPPYVFPEGYKRSRRHTGQQAEKICDEAEGDSTGSTDRPLKRRTDSEMGDLTPSRLEKRASISPQRLESLSPEFSSRFYTLSPLSSGEVKPNHTPDLLSHSQETLSFGQLDDHQSVKSQKSLPGDVPGQGILASHDICNRIKDACLVRKDEEISSFQSSQADSFQRAKGLIERVAKDDIDEVIVHEKSEEVENEFFFVSNASGATTINCEVSYIVRKTLG